MYRYNPTDVDHIFSITTDAWQYYGFTDAAEGESAISLLSIIFMAGMIIVSLPSLAAFERFGFKKAVGFGVVLTGVCALLRGFFGDSYTMVLIITIGFAIAQPFLLNSPGLVAGKWFPEKERATANSVGLLCSYLGMCVGLLLTPVLLESGMTIKGMLLTYGIVGALAALYGFFIVGGAPLTLTFAAESCYPTSEGTSEDLLMFAGNVAGVIFLGAASLFGTNHRMLMITMIAVTIFYIVLMFFAREVKLEKSSSGK